MTVVDRLDELQASSVGRRECSMQHTAANGSQTHGRTCRHIESALSTGDGLWPLSRHMMEVSQGSGVWAALCIRRTLCRHVTICTPMVIFLLFDCLLTVFDEWYTVPIVKNTQKTVKTANMTIGVPIVTCLPRLYQQCTNCQKQSKQHKNDH